MRTPGIAPSRILAGGVPEGPMFGLRKAWQDPGPGIEMVQIEYAWTPIGREPDWESGESRVLSPDPERPGVRSAVIEVPRRVAGHTDYWLHHFFFVVSGTQRIASTVIREDVVAHEVTYEDRVENYTHVGMVWGVPPAESVAVPNYTTATMDGLTFAPDAEHSGDANGIASDIYEFIRARPLPHVFRGLVWGLRGAALRYVFHLVTSGSPDRRNDREEWADHAGDGWRIDL